MSTRHTDSFAAGMMFVGISNNISKWGTSDIPEEIYLVNGRKRIWNDYQFYLERSPIFNAAQPPCLSSKEKKIPALIPGNLTNCTVILKPGPILLLGWYITPEKSTGIRKLRPGMTIP